MPKKKTKGKMIKVAKARKKRKSKKRKRPGRGQYSTFFPTNRQIDSNQYWQLRAEIAGAEARVRSSLKDRQQDEVKAEKKVKKLEEEVKRWKTPAATPPVVVQVPAPAVAPTPPVAQQPAQARILASQQQSTSPTLTGGLFEDASISGIGPLPQTPDRSRSQSRQAAVDDAGGLSYAATEGAHSLRDEAREQVSAEIDPGHGKWKRQPKKQAVDERQESLRQQSHSEATQQAHHDSAADSTAATQRASSLPSTPHFDENSAEGILLTKRKQLREQQREALKASGGGGAHFVGLPGPPASPPRGRPHHSAKQTARTEQSLVDSMEKHRDSQRKFKEAAAVLRRAAITKELREGTAPEPEAEPGAAFD